MSHVGAHFPCNHHPNRPLSPMERFKQECKLEEENLLQGKCQLCIDGILLIVSSASVIVNDVDEDQLTPTPKCQLALCGDQYLLSLVAKCPCVKIVFPPNKQFKGFIDLSLFQSCTALELVRIPFNQVTGVEKLRRQLRSLVWLRGNYESLRESILSFHHESTNSQDNFKPLRIDEIFWDNFGLWTQLNYLCISRSNITLMNASTIPNSIKTLDLRHNKITHFNNLANYSLTSTITKLCLEYNSLRELPKLNANTLSSLVYLSLRGNLLESVIGLRNFTSLDYLDLSENLISNSRQFLSEIVYLSSTLKTLFIDRNPISYDRHIQPKCESVLQNLINFNGKLTNLNHKQNNQQQRDRKILLADQTLHLANSLEPDPSNVSQGNPTTSIIKKASKERFVTINDDDDDDDDDDGEIVPKNINDKTNVVKNYFFGSYTGSYGSSQNNLINFSYKNESTVSLKNLDTDKINDNTLNDDGQMINDEHSVDFETSNKIDPSGNDKNSQEDSMSPSEQNQMIGPNDSSEWVSEDTEENTMFLVEIYSSTMEFEQSLNQDADYYFIRIRPRDGLIYEKDCTTGKVLQTLDLKILERYEKIQNNMTIRLYFDTCIITKKERIYRFLDEKSFVGFIEMFLSKYDNYRNQLTEALGPSDQINKKSSKTMNQKFTSPWFYMCLRCGDRTHRIITDCTRCGSDLIIKDESSHLKENDYANEMIIISDQESLKINNEETIDVEQDLFVLDENFFRSNVDHHLKLHIEIYLYERIGDDSLKSESVEVLFQCSVFDFHKQSFRTGLAVLTGNYFFLFNHLKYPEQAFGNDNLSPKKSSLYGSSNKDKEKEDIVSLIFYSPLANVNSSPLIISHLPKPIKNIGYWMEFHLNKEQRKILLKNGRLRKQQQFILELLLFGDEDMGKAFLELLFKFQKVCIRSNKQNNSNPINGTNLIIVKNSITNLIDGNDHQNGLDDRLKLNFDEKSRSLLGKFEDKSKSDNKICTVFFLESFQFLQNTNINPNQSSIFNNLFTMNENIVLLIIDSYLVIGELYCSFQKISLLKSSPTYKDTIAKLLTNTNNNFNDHIEIKTLFNESIINLLPNIYIDRNQFLLVMRFREDDENLGNQSKQTKFLNKTSTKIQQSTMDQTSQTSNLRIYEFKLQFLSLHSLMQTCQLICSCWESKFGVSLTLSKYRDNMTI